MQKPDKARTAPRARNATVECCTELRCESGLRNNYYEGKRLTPDTFRVEQRYLNERRRLLNRAIHGWGVVYGYALGVRAAKGSRRDQASVLRVDSGLAFDQCGRELLQVGGRDLRLDDLIVVDDKGRRTTIDQLVPQSSQTDQKSAPAGQRYEEPPEEMCWLLSVHYAEQSTDAVALTDACRCERHEWDHTCETVRYTLRTIPCDQCCADHPCELCCDCGTGRCCGSDPEYAAPRANQKLEQESDTEACERLPFERGGCRCLCDHLTQLQPGAECCDALCEIEEPCARVRVDLGHGVPLACIALVRDECDMWTIREIVDACGPRRLVKRNDLLFDLIRGCDLTRINEIGWAPWHRKTDAVGFDDFSAAFGADGYQQDEYVTRDFWVRFSRPVREDTIALDCFAMTILNVEREGKWRQLQRVPIVRIDTTVVPPEPGDPNGHVRGARIVVDGGWVEDALRGRGSVFFGDTWIELEVRGDFILDCNGQPVDANAVGRLATLTGNGVPGGTFLSTFQVAPREPYTRPVARETADRAKGASS